MSKLIWGEIDKRNYEYGVDRCVFYPKHGIGHAWSGIVSIDETTVDKSQRLIYMDGVGHVNEMLLGTFAASISAITYPEAFENYDGYSDYRSAQRRRTFDLSYRTMQDGGHYKIHLVYNATATPTQRNNVTLNTTLDVELFTWDISTIPVVIEDARPSSHFVIDTRLVNPGVVDALELRLYGTDTAQADFPSVSELLAIFEEYAIFRVIDHGDGTATITGPDSAVHLIEATIAELIWPSVVPIDSDTYRLSSL